MRTSLVVLSLLVAGTAAASSIRIQTLTMWTESNFKSDDTDTWLSQGPYSQTTESFFNGVALKASGRVNGREVGMFVSSPFMPGGIPAELNPQSDWRDRRYTFPSRSGANSLVNVYDDIFIPGASQSVSLVVRAKLKGVLSDPSGLGYTQVRYILATDLSGWSGTTGFLDTWIQGPLPRDGQIYDLLLPALIGTPFQLQIALHGYIVPVAFNGNSLPGYADFSNTAELEILGVVDQQGAEVIGALAALQSGLGIDYTPEGNDPPNGEVPEPGPSMLVALGLGLLALTRKRA